MASGFVGLGELPPVSGDGEFDKGFEAYYRGDYKIALAEWMPLAEKGTSWAKHNIGVMVTKGLVDEPSIGVATKLLLESGSEKLPNGMTLTIMDIEDPREK